MSFTSSSSDTTALVISNEFSKPFYITRFLNINSAIVDLQILPWQTKMTLVTDMIYFNFRCYEEICRVYEKE